MYDYIIIGGGIAGLYMNLLLTKNNKTLLLEKEDYFGGRAIQDKFHGVTIKAGAGIGALHNKNLLQLLKILKIKYDIVKSKVSLFDKHINLKHMITQIKNKYKTIYNKENKGYDITVKDFIIKYFDNDFFTLYSTYTEFTDYFDSSIESYIKYYPITDHIPSTYTALYIDWSELINKLILYITKYNTIRKNYTVTNIYYDNDKKIYIINNNLYTKNIIFAVTINSLSNILKQSKILKINYNNYIGYIPFIRIYTYHNNGHNLNIDRYSIINSKLHKIVIISDKILMISYSDNNNALYWKKYLNKQNILINKIKKEIKKIFDTEIIIDDIKIIFWDNGIHYYKPNGLSVKDVIRKLSNPRDNMYVIGEMLSKKQGWIEGAIWSCNDIHKIIK